MANFIERLKKVCNTNNVSEIARKTGVHYNTLKNYLGDTAMLPNSEMLVMIAETTNANINYLLTGKGAMYQAAEPAPVTDTFLGEDNEASETYVEVEIPNCRIRIKIDDLVSGRVFNTIPIVNESGDSGDI